MLEEALGKISEDDKDKEEKSRVYNVYRNVTLWNKKGDRAKARDSWIEERKHRDKQEEDRLNNAVPRTDIPCKQCGAHLASSMRTPWEDGQGHDRVLIMYKCPSGCLPGRAFYENGEEYVSKPSLCIKCNSVVKVSHNRTESKITSVSTCDSCGHVEKDVYDLNQKIEDPEPIDEALRKEYCLDEEGMREYEEAMRNLDQMREFMERIQREEADVETNKRMESLKRIRVGGVQKLLEEALKEINVSNVTVYDPTNDRGMKVRFSAIDLDESRLDKDTTKQVRSSIQEALHDTNWRLLKTSVESSLGAVRGELRGYADNQEIRSVIERENDPNKKRTK